MSKNNFISISELAKRLNLEYVYLGYYIKNAPRMTYKLKFKAGELFSDGKLVWAQIGFRASSISAQPKELGNLLLPK